MISKTRAAVTEQSITDWFQEVEDHLKEVSALEVLNYPSSIFNADEIGVQTCPKSGTRNSVRTKILQKFI